METIITIIIALGTGLAGSFSGWFFGRRKQRIDEIDAATETWKNIVDSLELQINKLLKARTADSLKIEELTNKVSELNEKISVMEERLKDIAKLERKIQRYEKIMDNNNIDY